MVIIKMILAILYINLLDKIMCIFFSRYYAKKCNYDCSKCGCWSCVNETEHDNKNYFIGIYDNYKNVCGKMGGIFIK